MKKVLLYLLLLVPLLSVAQTRITPQGSATTGIKNLGLFLVDKQLNLPLTTGTDAGTYPDINKKGAIRVNSVTNVLEYHDGVEWIQSGGGVSIDQDNIDILKTKYTLVTSQQERFQPWVHLNSLPSYTIDEKQSLWFKLVLKFEDSESVVPTTYLFKILNKGKGTYGIGGTSFGPEDLLLITAEYATAGDIIDLESTDIITITSLEGLSISEYVNEHIPPYIIQEQSEGYTIFQIGTDPDNLISYLYLGQGGSYGQGSGQTTDADFQLLSDNPIQGNYIPLSGTEPNNPVTGDIFSTEFINAKKGFISENLGTDNSVRLNEEGQSSFYASDSVNSASISFNSGGAIINSYYNNSTGGSSLSVSPDSVNIQNYVSGGLAGGTTLSIENLSGVIIRTTNSAIKGIVGEQEFNKQGDRKAFAQIADVEDMIAEGGNDLQTVLGNGNTSTIPIQLNGVPYLIGASDGSVLGGILGQNTTNPSSISFFSNVGNFSINPAGGRVVYTSDGVGEFNANQKLIFAASDIRLNGTIEIPTASLDNTVTKGLARDSNSKLVEFDIPTGGTTNPMTTEYDMIVGGVSGVPTRMASSAINQALITPGFNAKPTWGKIGLTTHVSGTLPIANGGTGTTTGISAAQATVNTSKANDADVLHKTGNETKVGNLTIDGINQANFFKAYRPNQAFGSSGFQFFTGSNMDWFVGQGALGGTNDYTIYNYNALPQVALQVLGSNSNVGIGKANPTERLDVAGNGKFAGDIEITDAAKGYILPSPDGTKWKITVTNAGVLVVTSVP